MQHISDIAGEALVPPAEFAFAVVAAVRRHPHVSNVLTHISGQNWARVEEAFRAILNPQTGPSDLTPLGRNIVDLICAERGVTGRLFKPYLTQVLSALTGPQPAANTLAHIARLAREDGP
ncbi:MAG: hypothetical protein KDJ76_10550 [Xanthobacteraceae bacterium]|nr:hypothetical protein [Xanthobacteraceae bacterium]